MLLEQQQKKGLKVHAGLPFATAQENNITVMITHVEIIIYIILS